MKRVGIVCIAVLLGMVAGELAEAVPLIENPVVLEDAMLSVTVSDLHGLLDGIGSVAAKISPMMNGMMLKTMLGSQLGDPQLAGIAPGKGLAVVALDPTHIFAVIEVAEAQMPAYTHALSALGMQSKYGHGLLVAGQTTNQVDKGMAYAEAVKNTLLAKRSPTLRIATKPSAMIEKNDEQIQGLLQMMPMMMGQGLMQMPGATLGSTEATLKMLESELRMALSVAQQIKAVEITLAPANGSIRINETFVPKVGSRLATLCKAPKTSQPTPRLQSGLFGKGMVLVDFSMGNPEALAEFVSAETQQILKEMEITDADLVGLVGTMLKWTKLYSGAGCAAFSFDAESGMNINYLLEIGDEAAALELLKTMPEDMAPLFELYEDMGMPMTFEFTENVREHGGIAIHSLGVDFSMEQMSEEMRKQMEAMKMTDMKYDIAIFDGLMLYTIGGTGIEAAIDRIKDTSTPVVPLKARSVYPEDGFYYLDLDVGQYMAFMALLMPEEQGTVAMPMGQLAAMLKDAAPITSAGYRDEGRVMWSLNIPGDLLAKIGRMAMMIQVQGASAQ